MTLWGDADCDGLVKMNDVVLILQSMSNGDQYGLTGSNKNHLTDKGARNADCYDPGSKLSPHDALAVQEYLLQKTELPVIPPPPAS